MKLRRKNSLGIIEINIEMLVLVLIFFIFSKVVFFAGDVATILTAPPHQTSLENLRSLSTAVTQLLNNKNKVATTTMPYFIDPELTLVGFGKTTAFVRGNCRKTLYINRPKTCQEGISCLCIVDVHKRDQPAQCVLLKNITIIWSPAYRLTGFSTIELKPEEQYLDNFRGIADDSLTQFYVPEYLPRPADTILMGQCTTVSTVGHSRITNEKTTPVWNTRNVYIEKVIIKDKTYIMIGAAREEESKRADYLRIKYQIEPADFENLLVRKKYEQLFTDAHQFWKIRSDEPETVSSVYTIAAQALLDFSQSPPIVITTLYPKLKLSTIQQEDMKNPQPILLADAVELLIKAAQSPNIESQIQALQIAMDNIKKLQQSQNLAEQQRVKKLIQTIHEQVRALPTSEEADYLRASLAFDTEKWAMATEKLIHYINIYPSSTQLNYARFQLGYAFGQQNKPRESLREYSTLINKQPSFDLSIGDKRITLQEAITILCEKNKTDIELQNSCKGIIKT